MPSTPDLSQRVVLAQTTSDCHVAHGTSRQVRGYLDFLVTAADPAHRSLRTTLHVPAMDSSKITYLSDSRTCARIAAVMSAVLQSGTVMKRVATFRPRSPTFRCLWMNAQSCLRG